MQGEELNESELEAQEEENLLDQGFEDPVASEPLDRVEEPSF